MCSPRRPLHRRQSSQARRPRRQTSRPQSKTGGGTHSETINSASTESSIALRRRRSRRPPTFPREPSEYWILARIVAEDEAAAHDDAGACCEAGGGACLRVSGHSHAARPSASYPGEAISWQLASFHSCRQAGLNPHAAFAAARPMSTAGWLLVDATRTTWVVYALGRGVESRHGRTAEIRY